MNLSCAMVLDLKNGRSTSTASQEVAYMEAAWRGVDYLNN